VTAIPPSVAELVDVLTTMPGTLAVVLGGSRAVRTDDEESDWDLGQVQVGWGWRRGTDQ
jgi:predicted nucleotidyltransferase